MIQLLQEDCSGSKWEGTSDSLFGEKESVRFARIERRTPSVSPAHYSIRSAWREEGVNGDLKFEECCSKGWSYQQRDKEVFPESQRDP